MTRSLTTAWLIAALLPLAAQAATVQVTVLGRDGKPLADAVVVIEPGAGAKPAAPAPVSTVINQQKMQFLPGTVVLPVGSKVTFTNHDSWEHHVRGTPAGLASLNPGTQPGFELRLDGKAEGKEPSSADVTLTTAGAVQLGCHLHGSMRGFIFVTDSPWTLQTDANGMAIVQGVPEGAARVRVVHADQLIEAPPVAVTITPVTALNLPTQVQPRRRRP
ncbi:MAG: plastocyanin [Hydrogenophaga sp.]|uniref:cupredoxin domain-containing protein n=1 Tax=Hydrogenophaga sp. TaxID=1904254 RepID=UPI002AB92C73|nr:plastocyanin [Hydrogenophaga sp.]MDZ4102841.1 plastocyanin [Hydrogenophaga sp.]